ncbi:MAG: DUF2017 family protein [Acidimicrobiia bacterium]
MASVWRADGRVFVRLPGEERAVLAQLPQLVGGVGAAAEDAAADRLRPDAYPDDAEAAREFTRMTESDLDTARREDADAFEATLDGIGTTGLSLEEAESWVRMLGDARLVLAAREGIARDGELPRPSMAKPRLALVHYLGALQQEIVEVLLSSMADT